jgi:tetratricopeptide (TPR) repeat protein
MRLLQLQNDGEFSLVEYVGVRIPPYAILSHTWGPPNEEVVYKDLMEGKGKNKKGYQKLTFCGKQAANDGLRHFWIDSCCIIKESSAELSEAINSMFRWYQEAVKCYVYLSDVSTTGSAGSRVTFSDSRWFARGWTLQELLAPTCVEFFSLEGDLLGSKSSNVEDIARITMIPSEALLGTPISRFSVDERMAWTKGRETTREEDMAYSLFGIFGVHMPLIYGEGKENALRRLRKEILELSKHPADSVLHNEQREGLSSSATAAYCIPFPKNRSFVGRRDELETLKQKLRINQDCQKISIVGLGGTGKTQVALQFAYTVKETWQEYSVFWLPALSLEGFEQACASIAKVLQIPEAADEQEDPKEQVRKWLSAEGAERWLLILDNADDPQVLFGTGDTKGIIDYLPENEVGMTVYTTRTLEVAVSLTGNDVLELGAMSQQDAASFLKKSLIGVEMQNDSAADELLDELACLPLAISQAAAYLNMNRTPIKKYLKLLQSTEHDTTSLMSREFRDGTRYKGSANAVATTWVVSFQQIYERSIVAAELLMFISCIEWKAIPRSILPGAQVEEQVEEAIGILSRYSFLARRNYNDESEEEEWYDMHRLVHLATRIWTSKHSHQEEAAEKAIKHTSKIFPSADFANRAVWRRYMPHVLRLLSNKLESDKVNENERSELCLSVGRCLQVDGKIREAVQWLEESCQWRSRLDEKNPSRLASQHVLAGAYNSDGQVKKAVALLEHIVAVDAELLDEEDAHRLDSELMLARAYLSDGQVKKAVKMLEHVAAVEMKVLEEEDPQRLISQQVLAQAYQANGQVKKAIELLEHVVATREKVLDEEYPDRLTAQHELARAYQADGRVKKAIELLEHVVSVGTKVLEEGHPHQLTSQNVLAQAYTADGQIKKAVELLEYVVVVRKKILKEEHPDRLLSQNELARAYREDGQLKKAAELLEHVVTVRKRVLEEEHQDLLGSQHTLARVYRADGRLKKAIELLEHVVTVRERVLEEENLDRLASQYTLARAYRADGQTKKAIELLEHVVATEAKVLEEGHPDRLLSQRELARAYQADEQVQGTAD